MFKKKTVMNLWHCNFIHNVFDIPACVHVTLQLFQTVGRRWSSISVYISNAYPAPFPPHSRWSHLKASSDSVTYYVNHKLRPLTSVMSNAFSFYAIVKCEFYECPSAGVSVRLSVYRCGLIVNRHWMFMTHI